MLSSSPKYYKDSDRREMTNEPYLRYRRVSLRREAIK
jgi:hypothetical protein